MPCGDDQAVDRPALSASVRRVHGCGPRCRPARDDGPTYAWRDPPTSKQLEMTTETRNDM